MVSITESVKNWEKSENTRLTGCRMQNNFVRLEEKTLTASNRLKLTNAQLMKVQLEKTNKNEKTIIKIFADLRSKNLGNVKILLTDRQES